MTVNHDVAGSSPAGGAIEKPWKHYVFEVFSFQKWSILRRDKHLQNPIFENFHRMSVNQKIHCKIWVKYGLFLINIQPPIFCTFALISRLWYNEYGKGGKKNDGYSAEDKTNKLWIKSCDRRS